MYMCVYGGVCGMWRGYVLCDCCDCDAHVCMYERCFVAVLFHCVCGRFVKLAYKTINYFEILNKCSNSKKLDIFMSSIAFTVGLDVYVCIKST